MKRYDQLSAEMLARVGQYFTDHPVTPANVDVTALVTEVNTLRAESQSLGGTQMFGRGGFRSGAVERQVLGKDLRTFLADMSATARGLERQRPGIAEQFRLGLQSKSYATLIAAAQGFLDALVPAEVKALFVARLFPADLDVQLTAKIAALAAATGRKLTGLQAQKEGSAGLTDLSRRITATMKELRPLMVRHLRDNDPNLLEVWKAAARRYRRRGSTAPTVPAPGSGTGDSDSGTTPPITAG